MDKNASIERRYSFNSSGLPQPIAESTCLNGTPNKNFRWGGKPISPLSRSNSSLGLSSNRDNRTNSMRSPVRAKLNMTKIEPRMYADVQSKGLASRIVKYHESGTRLNRSLSMNNLHTRPGQFPVVHLKKTELPYRAVKQNMSMTRIPPPGKSMYCGNTLSSLLRSNSIVSLQKSDEEISRENRPILHPPPTESDLTPTRSVLDVLKEISRKRINSEGADPSDKKKYCRTELINDTVDTAQAVVQHVRNFNALTQAQKRQREQMNQPYYQPQQVARSQTTPPMRPDCVQAAQQQQHQHSPEQVAKKRLKCNYNNDITSSLSSSMNQYKRKAGKTTPPRQNTSLNTSSSHSPKAKVQRQQSELHIEQLSKTLTCTTPITPIPATPAERCTAGVALAGQPQRTVSEPVYPTSNTNVPMSAPAPAPLPLTNKPKLTLFNRQYDESSEVTRDVDGAADTGGDYAGVQFVKPKKIGSISGGKNAFMERTQKSKLALMLCGLKGEIYQGEVDEPDASKQQQSKRNEAKMSFSSDVTGLTNETTTTAATTTISSISESKTKAEPPPAATVAAPATNVQNASPPAAAAPVTPPTMSSATVAASTTPPASSAPTLTFSFGTPTAAPIVSPTTNNQSANKVKSPLVGLKLTPQSTTPPTFATSTTTAANSFATSGMPTFTFGAAPAAVSAAAVSAPVPPAVTSVATNNATSVGTPPTTNTTNAAATPLASLPKLQGFAFGSSALGASSKANPTGFSFGQNANKTAQQPTFAGLNNSAPQANPTNAPVFGFNSTPSTSTAATGGLTSTNSTPSGTFAFGTPAANQSAPVIVPATKSFTFGSAAAQPTTAKGTVPAFGTAAGAASTNVFGAPTSNSGNTFLAQGANKSFSFGAPAAPVTTTAAVTTSSGGMFAAHSMTSTAPAAGMFSTGATNAAPASNNSGMFSFGGANAQKPAAFSFGSNSTATTAPPAGSTATVTQTTNALAFGQTASAATSSAFTFGAGTGAAATTAAAGSNKPFAFGSGASSNASANNAAPMFGANAAPNNTAPAFSFNAPAVPTPSSTSLFGSSSNGAKPAVNATPSFVFGAKSDAAAPAAGAFSFGTPASTTAAAVPQAQSNTAVVKPLFGFAGGFGASTSEPPKNLFGASAANTAANSNTFASLANNQSRTFSFGGNANNTAPAPAAPTNLFGSAASTNNTTPAAAASNNLFGNTASSNNSNQAASPPPFAFGASNQSAPVASPTNSFSFGAPANNAAPATNTNTPFAFGGSTAQAGAAAAPAQPFSFGAASAAPNNSSAPAAAGNPFGAMSTSSPAASPPFSFGANVSAAPSPSPNIFAPPPTMAGPGDRPIRRATRRLQKP